VLGFAVNGRHYAGTSLDWIQPFVLLVGVGLVFGYVLLGATWLIMKTEGALQAWARKKAEFSLFGVLAFVAMVSAWTPLLEPRIAARWFGWPNTLFLSPVPIVTLLLAWWLWRALTRLGDNQPFFAAMGLFAMCYLGLGISTFPYIVPHSITLWEAASAPESQAFLLLGTLLLLPIILMYTGWSYWVFRGKVRSDFGHH
jgi:cytochrome bd ubiquinol oxidase subunit II